MNNIRENELNPCIHLSKFQKSKVSDDEAWGKTLICFAGEDFVFSKYGIGRREYKQISKSLILAQDERWRRA